MKVFALAIAAVQGLVVVGLLFLLEAVVRAVAPAWSLPFSQWWGLLFCIPGLGMAYMVNRRF